MTLSLEEGQARLLVLKGDRIIAWRSGQIAQHPDEPAEDPTTPADFHPFGHPDGLDQLQVDPAGLLPGQLQRRDPDSAGAAEDVPHLATSYRKF